LTGQIGSGKTEAARVFRRLGCAVIDADRIGREVVDNSAGLRRELARDFGSDIFDKRGNLRRRKLASLAFVSQHDRDKLNRLVHPHLLRELRRQVKNALKSHAVVVIDAALLLHWGMDREVDFVLVIHAGRELRLRRLQKRGISRTDALARERAQLPYREFQKRSDRVILNNGSLAVLRRKVKDLYARLAPSEGDS
jgi:dephospho-CoA kinase